jgi:hypothetical protein
MAQFIPTGQELTYKPDGTVALTGSPAISLPQGTAENVSTQNPARASNPGTPGAGIAFNQGSLGTRSTSNYNRPNPETILKYRNPMEVFASSNILWTFACLTPAQFNDPRSYRNSPGELKNIVFSSGGRFDSQRQKIFISPSVVTQAPEYYINNFMMKNIIGANEATGNSNAVKFEFDIIEPHSMGLLLQSMQAAAINATYLSYMDNTPWVLRMDIQGFDQLGRVISNIKPKFFVLKLTGVKFTVNEGGSTYKVEGIPYNHQGFASSINISYSDVKLSAGGKGHVFDILAGGEGSLTTYLNNNEEKLLKDKEIKVKDEYVIQFPILSSDWKSSAGNQEAIKKATVDLNEKEQIVAVSASTIKIDPQLLDQNSIASAGFGFDASSGGRPLFKRAGDQYDEKTGVMIRDGMTIDPKKRAFHFAQKQSLTSIINQIILSSEYATEALDPQKLTPQGFIKWFKLDVQIELLSLDDLTGDYGKRITFRVVPYYVHQSLFANATSAPIGYSQLLKDVVKEYQYIYTGQNVDVLSFNVQINNLFYSGATPKKESEAAKTATQDQNIGENLPSSTSTKQGQAPEVQAAPMGRHRPRRDPRLLAGYKGGSGQKSVEQNVAENFQQVFISGNSADLVTIDLEILGDPYWLVDSGMANHFSSSFAPTDQVTEDGTMNYESGNVYIYLTFRTPIDVNTTTGLYDFSQIAEDSPFGGIYRIVQCENTFNDGNWKQKLKCIRMPGPQGPETVKTVKAINPETGKEYDKLVTAKADTPATAIGPKEPPKTSVVDAANGSTNRTTVANNGAASASANTTDSLRNSSRRAAKEAADKKATTTSNQAPIVAGFRYYRDLGQK